MPCRGHILSRYARSTDGASSAGWSKTAWMKMIAARLHGNSGSNPPKSGQEFALDTFVVMPNHLHGILVDFRAERRSALQPLGTPFGPAAYDRPDYWLRKFSELRIDRARGDPAPHEPLLLLALCDLAEQGALPHGALPLSPELAFRFYRYWSIVAGRRPQRPDVRLPFHHLAGDEALRPPAEW